MSWKTLAVSVTVFSAVCASIAVLPTGCGGTGLKIGDSLDGGGTNPTLDGGSNTDGASLVPVDSGSNRLNQEAGTGSGGCPIYEKVCAGACIPISSDPHNCGGCGVTCTSGEVCSAGVCSSSCLEGLNACNGMCADTQNDNDNCGACGHSCGTGMGCVAGQCATSIGMTSSASCAGGGPPVHLGNSTAGCVAQTTFTWALCSCKDVNMTGALLTDAFDSTQGPYKPGGLGGGTGLNGKLISTASVDTWGALWASSSEGQNTTGSVDVRQETHLGGPLTTTASTILEDETLVDGDVTTTSKVSVGKTLTVPASSQLIGNVTYASLVRAPVSVPPPCDCEPQDLLPIPSWIAAARPPNNDNATIGLDPNALAAGRQQPTRIDLPCGRFYLTGISSTAPVTIAAHGNTALFIDGNVNSTAMLAFVLDPTAQFDVVVSGTITDTAALVVGSPNYPALSRTYIGASSGLSFTASWRMAGNVYAAYGPVDFTAALTTYGGLFAGDFTGTGGATIHFDRAVAGGSLCPPASSSPGSPPPSMCGSCKDCGNQACVNGMCGSCTSSDQCCAPLTCQDGKCVEVVE